MDAQQAARLFGLLDDKGRWAIPPDHSADAQQIRTKAAMSPRATVPLRLRSEAGLRALLPVVSPLRADVIQRALDTGEVQVIVRRGYDRIFGQLKSHADFVLITRETKLFSFHEAAIIEAALPQCVEVALVDDKPAAPKRSK